nr:TcpD family membrane protein [Lactococcus protaetiae]
MDLFQALWKLGSGPFLAWMGFKVVKEMHSHKTMGLLLSFLVLV